MRTFLKKSLENQKATARSLLDKLPSDAVNRGTMQDLLAKFGEQERALEEHPDGRAKVILKFGGAPVQDRKSIDAKFGAAAVGAFQDVVQAQLVSLVQGPLNERGPLPLRDASNLRISDVVRGSFGFVLEEGSQMQLKLSSDLSQAVDETIDLLALAASEDEELSTRLLVADGRLLDKLREFASLVDRSEATVSVFGGTKRVELDRFHMAKASGALSQTQINTHQLELNGILSGLLPAKRQFEFEYLEEEQTLSGRISAEISHAALLDIARKYILQPCHATIQRRTVTRGSKVSEPSFTLLSVQNVPEE